MNVTPDTRIAELRANPALLKLDLYCRGVRLDGSCFVEEDGGRKILRTRAGLGSGLELILPGNLWTNVPVTERDLREIFHPFGFEVDVVPTRLPGSPLR